MRLIDNRNWDYNQQLPIDVRGLINERNAAARHQAFARKMLELAGHSEFEQQAKANNNERATKHRQKHIEMDLAEEQQQRYAAWPLPPPKNTEAWGPSEDLRLDLFNDLGRFPQVRQADWMNAKIVVRSHHKRIHPTKSTQVQKWENCASNPSRKKQPQ